MATYDQATQDGAALEIEAGSAPVLTRMVRDYADLRARLRAGCAP